MQTVYIVFVYKESWKKQFCHPSVFIFLYSAHWDEDNLKFHLGQKMCRNSVCPEATNNYILSVCLDFITPDIVFLHTQKICKRRHFSYITHFQFSPCLIDGWDPPSCFKKSVFRQSLNSTLIFTIQRRSHKSFKPL
mgnify:CR=1 FL=1